MNIDYKKIQVELDDNILFDVKNAIEEINKSFSKDNFYLEINKNNLIFNLRIIDLDKFKEKLKELNVENLFDKLIEKIENIKSYGIKSGKRLYIDYNKERKVKNRLDKVKERGMYFYALDNDFSKENNELPKQYENKIICADSEEFLKKFPDNCIDLVFTSPPYNFGLDYENHKDGIDWNEYFNKLFAVFKECIRVIKYGGRIIINVQPLFSDYIPIHHIISDFFMKNKMIWRNEILWEKNNYNCKYTAWGSWKSPSNPYLKYTWEFIEVFCKESHRKEGSVDKIDISGEEFKKWVYAKWDIAPEINMKKYDHPAMFPEELVVRLLKLFSYQDDIVLDPFNGVGTTTLVAHKLKRRYIGIDISKEYCEAAEKRLRNEKRQKRLF